MDSVPPRKPDGRSACGGKASRRLLLQRTRKARTSAALRLLWDAPPRPFVWSPSCCGEPLVSATDRDQRRPVSSLSSSPRVATGARVWSMAAGRLRAAAVPRISRPFRGHTLAATSWRCLPEYARYFSSAPWSCCGPEREPPMLRSSPDCCTGRGLIGDHVRGRALGQLGAVGLSASKRGAFAVLLSTVVMPADHTQTAEQPDVRS